MIEVISKPTYRVGQIFFETFQEAQTEALLKLFEGNPGDAESIANRIIEVQKEILAILTPPKESRSRRPRKQRSDKGIKKGPRKHENAGPAN
jgi:hypothetical protein